MKIGVFDSGVGGQSVANAIQNQLPNLEIMVVEDKANLPYGSSRLFTIKNAAIVFESVSSPNLFV